MDSEQPEGKLMPITNNPVTVPDRVSYELPNGTDIVVIMEEAEPVRIDTDQADGYVRFKQTCDQLKRVTDNYIAQSLAEAQTHEWLMGIYTSLDNSVIALEEVKGIPGISQYARDQTDDPNYDVVAAGLGLETETRGVLTWLEENIPDGTVTVDGVITPSYTVEELQPVRNQLQKITDRITTTR